MDCAQVGRQGWRKERHSVTVGWTWTRRLRWLPLEVWERMWTLGVKPSKTNFTNHANMRLPCKSCFLVLSLEQRHAWGNTRKLIEGFLTTSTKHMIDFLLLPCHLGAEQKQALSWLEHVKKIKWLELSYLYIGMLFCGLHGFTFCPNWSWIARPTPLSHCCWDYRHTLPSSVITMWYVIMWYWNNFQYIWAVES